MPSSEARPDDCDLRCPTRRHFLTVPSNQSDHDTVLHQCTVCDVVFEDPRPSRQEIDAFYGNEQIWTETTDAEGKPRGYMREVEFKRPMFRDLVRRIEEFKQSGRLLDVGSGPGVLQTELDDSRWCVEGLEASPHAVKIGQEQLGSNVRYGIFGEEKLESSAYDVVVMKWVLDHMESPLGALREARRVLKPGGLLVVADLINIESFAARVFREGHRLIHPLHFTYFSPATIRDQMSDEGFRVERIDFPFFRTPYFTASGTLDLAGRVVQRLLGRPVISTAWYGSMMDVFSVADEASL